MDNIFLTKGRVPQHTTKAYTTKSEMSRYRKEIIIFLQNQGQWLNLTYRQSKNQVAYSGLDLVCPFSEWMDAHSEFPNRVAQSIHLNHIGLANAIGNNGRDTWFVRITTATLSALLLVYQIQPTTNGKAIQNPTDVLHFSNTVVSQNMI